MSYEDELSAVRAYRAEHGVSSSEPSSASQTPTSESTGSSGDSTLAAVRAYRQAHGINTQAPVAHAAPATSDRGRGNPSHLRQSMAEGSPVRIGDAQAIYATTDYDKDGNALDVEPWGAKLKEDAKAAEKKTAELTQKLARLQTSRDSDRLLQEKAPLLHMLFRGRSSGDNSEEIEATKKALEEAQAEQAKIQRAQQYAAQHSAPAKSPNEKKLEEARSGGRSYADIFTESGAKVDDLKAMLADYNRRLDDAKRTYGRLWNVTDEGKTASRMVEDITRQLEQEQAYRDYVSGFLTQDEDAGSEQIIRQGEERAKTLKEQFLAGNMPDPTSNADYRGWLESNTDKTARDYAEQQYADREPNENWTQEEKNQYFALMTISPDSAYQFAVGINSAINSEANAAAAERFGNLFSNYDMSKEARAGRSGIMNAVMGLGNMASDVAGIAGGVATGPVKLFNWLDNIYQTNQRGGYYAGNSTPSISDYTDRLLNQNAERLNNRASFRDDIPVLGGKGLGDLYQLVESVAQSMAYGGGLTKAFSAGATTAAGIEAAKQAAKLSTGLIFFGQAADSSYNEYIQRGMSREQAAVGSFFAGLAEAAGEEFSIDHLIDDGISKGLAQYVAKQSFIETTEEGFTNVLNLFGDELAARLTGGESKMRQDIRMLMRNGVGRKDAEREVWKQFVDDTVFDMFGGTLSGGLSAGAYVAPNALYNYTQNRNKRNQQNQQTAQPAQQTHTNAAQGPATTTPLYEALKPRTEPVAESATTSQTPENVPQTQEAPTGEITPPTAQNAQSAAGAQPQAAEAATEQPKTLEERRKDWQRRFDDALARSETADSGDAALSEEFDALDAEDRQLEAEETQARRVQGGEVSKGFGTPENHIDRRTPESVGNTGVKSFQFDNPQLHGYYVEEAQALFNEVERADAAELERAMKRERGSAITGPIRRLMDMGLTKPQIVKCLQDIIADNGQENYAAAKRVELVLNDMLTNGWQGQRGRNDWHEANADYIAAKDAIDGGVKADSWERFLAQNELSLIDGTVTEEELRAEWERMHPQVGAAPGPSQPAETASTRTEQSAGAIPASEQTTAEKTNGQGPQRERGMSENLRNNEKAEPDLRNSFEQNRDLYTQLTNAEVAKKAAEIVGKGYDAAKNDIYQKIGHAKAGAKLAPEYAVAGYQLANEMVRRGETEAARELCADIAAELTYAGQVGQIGRLILAADPSIRIRTVNRLVQKLNDSLSNRQKAKNVKKGVGTESGEIKVSNEALQRYAESETDEAATAAMDAIEQEIADQIPATFRDKFTALRYLNMLGNLKTQGRNIVGNTAMMAATNAKYLTQHVIELARAAATGGEYQGNTALNTSKELRQQAAADFEAHMDEIQGDVKYADVGRQAAKGVREKQQIFGTTGNALWDNTIGRGLEGARKATKWAMEVGDEIFLRQVYVRSFAGWMKAHGVTDVNNASAEQVSAAREFAKKESQEATFHDSNKVSDWVSSLGRGQDTPKVVKMISEGIVPFRKTPANVAVRAVEYSPVGIALTIYTEVQAKKGNASAADVINSAAKNLTGMALFAAGMMLAAAGRARASGDDEDEKLNNFKKLQGEMDYSVKVGDKYISLSQLAPMAIPFFMGVKLNELLEYSDNLFSADSIGDILGVVSEPMLEMSMLSGVNDFLNDLSSLNGDTDGLPALVTNAALSYLSQGLTNSLLGQLEQMSERNRQTTYSDTKSADATAFDRFLGKNQYKIGKYSAKIPGIDYNQQDYVDAWGRTQSNGGAGERAFNALLNPTYTGKDRSTDVDAELERLYRDNKGKEGFPDVFPQKRSRSDTIGDGIVMTPDEYLDFSKESGQKKLELVREFIQSSDYKNLTDEQRAETIHNLYAFADATALQKVRDANGVTVKNEYAKISDLSNVPAYLAATERFKAEAKKERKTFNGWTNTSFEQYVTAGLNTEDLDVLAESALSDTRKPAYDLMREVGMSPKEYMDAIALMDGEKHDGKFKQADVYSWLSKNTTMSTEQKNQLWDMLGDNWKTSFSNYEPK